MSVMNQIRRVGDLPGVREVALRPPVRRALSGALRLRYIPAAWQITQPLTLLRREITDRGSMHQYTLRRSGMPVWARQGHCLEGFNELFRNGEYEPPTELLGRFDRDPLRILDIGGHTGMLSAWLLTRWPRAQITAFEPDPEGTPVYKAWAESVPNPPTLIEAAASNKAGTIHFHSGLGGGSHLSEDESDIEVPMVDIFDYLPNADFVKIDIEGGEWPILTDPRMADLHDLTLVMEYHRHMAPYWPPRDAAKEYLEKAGFTTGFEKPNYWGHGVLWAWKN